MAKVNGKNKKKIIVIFAVIAALIILLTFRLAWIQVVDNSEYVELAKGQQYRDNLINAKRGNIYDRQGKPLATSAICYDVIAMPDEIRKNSGEKTGDISKDLAVALDIKAKDIEKMLNTNSNSVTIASKLDKEVADKVKKLNIYGVNVYETTKRFYPLGNFASQLIGCVHDEGYGRSGLELWYDDYLSGIAGRWSKDSDRDGNALSYGSEEFYNPKDGLNVVSTLDEVLQHYAEQAVQHGMEETDADRIMCIGMDPKTGEILTMVSNPGFDPNEPLEPADKSEKEAFDKLSIEEQNEYIGNMWRCPLISDVYEPGSTFKLITTSSVLEEGVATPESRYYCNRSYTVPGTDVTLNCWSDVPHGSQTLKEAVGNSCNPVQIQISAQLGKEKFYEYLDMFGITKPTGIDFPAESYYSLLPEKEVGPVELATMSYGQGIALTPIQLATAVSTIVNDGVMMKPRLVNKLTDSNGKTVQEFKPEIVRKVISKKTSEEMRDIMEYVVSEGGGSNAKIPGYRIGGKTGTAFKSIDGGYSNDTYSSFVGVAPIDDPKIVFLVVVDTPKGITYGSAVAAPIAKEFFEKSFNHLEISPEYTEEEIQENNVEMIYTPDVIDIKCSEAIRILGEMGLDYKVLPKSEKEENLKIVDQYPKSGKKIKTGGTVYLYTE